MRPQKDWSSDESEGTKHVPDPVLPRNMRQYCEVVSETFGVAALAPSALARSLRGSSFQLVSTERFSRLSRVLLPVLLTLGLRCLLSIAPAKVPHRVVLLSLLLSSAYTLATMFAMACVAPTARWLVRAHGSSCRAAKWILEAKDSALTARYLKDTAELVRQLMLDQAAMMGAHHDSVVEMNKSVTGVRNDLRSAVQCSIWAIESVSSGGLFFLGVPLTSTALASLLYARRWERAVKGDILRRANKIPRGPSQPRHHSAAELVISDVAGYSAQLLLEARSDQPDLRRILGFVYAIGSKEEMLARMANPQPDPPPVKAATQDDLKADSDVNPTTAPSSPGEVCVLTTFTGKATLPEQPTPTDFFFAPNLQRFRRELTAAVKPPAMSKLRELLVDGEEVSFLEKSATDETSDDPVSGPEITSDSQSRTSVSDADSGPLDWSGMEHAAQRVPAVDADTAFVPLAGFGVCGRRRDLE
ncbi:MAG: uncharacterized protein KVP18_000916 [Porospora cf. gigantea A]|uniref:uncharacterized protein n=1 Tax=Porospora cf. gigantea A TaxID=2853593 RepID=UPI003559A049|nr:MAG: hypothetical protein KVP18_000916 [Porospora cf. gigantea A]